MKPLSVCVAVLPPRAQYPFADGERLLFLGEIENMPGHCVVVNRAGKVFWGYHTDNFQLPKDGE